MLCEFSEPCVRDEDTLFPLIVWLNAIAFLLGIRDHILHVLVFKGAKDAKEKVSLWKFARELLL